MSALKDIISALSDSGIIGLVSHINSDGDSVGSLIALGTALRRMGKEVYASIPDPGTYPPQYLFLPGRNMLTTTDNFEKGVEVFVALDCSNPERLGPLREELEKARLTVNIDHHEDNTFFANLNLVDDKASSTAELVYKLLVVAGWGITPEEATCLYTGVVTDTGRFQHRNTSPGTFTLASELAGAGADLFRVIDEVYESRSLSYTRLLGRALQRAEMLEEHGLIYSYITLEDLKETDAVLSETEDMIDHLRVIRGARMVALFKETEDGKVRVSLRSHEGFEVGPIARAMGGGGHSMAAGYTSELDIKKSIEILVGVLRNAR